jgi:hypothetical protein
LAAACSESQGGAGGDFGTNYCNGRMLYCGSDASGCSYVTQDWTFTELEVSTSSAAVTTEASDCVNGLNVGKLKTCGRPDKAKMSEWTACLQEWNAKNLKHEA